jgi:hypothetical protein
MAEELEDAPWIKKGTQPASATDLPDAPWAKPGTLEDMAKTAPGALTTGILSPVGMGGDLQGMMPEKSSWLENTFPKLTKFLKEDTAKHPLGGLGQGLKEGTGDVPGTYKLPSTKELKSGVEQVTGPMDYQPQTAGGRILDTTLKVAPSLAMGGESIPGLLAKSAGSGAMSEGASDTASALKGHLPTSWQPYAEPVARAVGAVAGAFTPAGARRAVTPLPADAAQTAARQALPDLPSTAGQFTDRGWLRNLEAYSPRAQGIVASQPSAYTQGVMGLSGAPNSMFDAAGKQLAAQGPENIRLFQNANRMTQPEFASLNADVARMGRPGSELYKAVGPSNAFDKAREAIRLGPTGGSPLPFDMTGERYGALKDILKTAGEKAPTTVESTAINNARDRMNQAFRNSMPPPQSNRLQNLERQHSNWKTIEDINTNPDQNTITPNQVFNRAPVGSELETHATNASHLMKPLPEPSENVPNLVPVLGTAALSALGAGAHAVAGGGLSGATLGGLEGSLPGLFGVPYAYKVARDQLGRVAGSAPAQKYLGNQRWMPGRNTSADPDLMARLLMTSPVKGDSGK